MADVRWINKWLLFFSSYIPLYLILAVKHLPTTARIPDNNLPIIQSISGVPVPFLSVSWLLLIVISAGALWLVFNTRRSKGADDFQHIESYKSRDELITSYILVYIFPFVVLDYTSIANWLAFVIFFIVIGIIQTRSNQLYVNPILAIVGYQIYEIDTGDQILTLLTRDSFVATEPTVRTVELSNNVHLSL